ncbi:MAG: porin family protein [Candidatus Eisenbacteria bacterium]
MTIRAQFLSVLISAASLSPSTGHAAFPPVTLKGGLSIASISGQAPSFDPESKLGIMGGVEVAFPAHSGLTVCPEVGFAMRGFSYGESEFTDEAGNTTGTFETLSSTLCATLAVPLRIALTDAGPARIEALAGAMLAFEIGERFVTTGDSETSMKSDVLRGTDYGLIGGGAVHFPAGPGRWVIEGRYVYGFARLSRGGPVEANTRAIEIVTGYTFNPRR